MTSVIGGMGGAGLAPNRASAEILSRACGLEMSGTHWMLFGDIERAWISIVNERAKLKE